MSSRRRIGAAVLLAAVLTPSASAGAPARGVPVAADSPLLWATVNVCDTEDAPNTIGIRGSMPVGRDDRERLWMRFRVEYHSDVDDRWHYVVEGGDSGFVPVKSPNLKARQAGRSFRIEPNAGEPVLLRGRVSFEWRRGGEAVRRATMRTRRGFESSAGADPDDYSAATCTVTP